MSAELKKQLKEFALGELGFDLCGVCAAEPDSVHIEKNRNWLSLGYNANMGYLERHMSQRENPENVLAGLKTVIILAKNYRNTKEQFLTGTRKISRYAVGLDYHRVIGQRLSRFSEYIRSVAPEGTDCFEAVDNNPLNERSYALRAGFGARGKNCLLINPRLGSYMFIAMLGVNIELEPDIVKDIDPDICLDCTKCMDACPTGALTRDGINASLCTSYRTIERSDTMAPDEARQTRGWVYGCDLCQEVCPLNNKGDEPLTDWKEFMPESGVGFDFFKSFSNDTKISKDTCLYRARGKIRRNLPVFQTLESDE